MKPLRGWENSGSNSPSLAKRLGEVVPHASSGALDIQGKIDEDVRFAAIRTTKP